MSDLYSLKVGDPVRVFEQYRRSVPPGGRNGEVVKVGRKLITVKYQGTTNVFRLEDGLLNSRDFSTYAEIKTVEQVAEQHRRSKLLRRLRDYGLGLARHHQPELSTETLAAVVAVLEAKASGE